MPELPDSPHLECLKKQAKDLLRLYRRREPIALDRLRHSLPVAAKLSDAEIVARALRLHDAQSCIAREYGFASWPDLADALEAQSLLRRGREELARRWLRLAYGGEVTGSYDAARPRLAARLLAETPGLASDDLYAACAAGDETTLTRALATDPAAVNREGGLLNLPPLIAATHSQLMQLPEYRERLRRCVRLLLQAGADPNASIGNRFPPASLVAPDESARLSALYGAAGVNRDLATTELLLDAGADPNDGESLYHSLEQPECARLLLQRGARVIGTNAVGRALDMPRADALELLLAHGGDANEVGSGALRKWGSPLLRAIAVRASPAHVRALLAAGADPLARTPQGIGAYPLALQAGLRDAADLLRAAGGEEPLSEEDAFVAACARADADEARRIQARRPNLPQSLPPHRLRLLPDTAAWGSAKAARVMVELGWPIAARGGDWDATALNLAVFRGDGDLTGFLLAHGADWRERHGYGGDVLGTLSFASTNEPVPEGDWATCARLLRAHGLPAARRDPADPETVNIDGRTLRFSEEVAEALAR